MKYFTSDTHFGHENIIRYCDRPFVDVREMNLVMLSNLQQMLTDDDDLYFLGDWCMNPKYYRLIRSVPFRHLFFILGNHDRSGKLKEYIEADGLSERITVKNEMTVEIAGKPFYLVHRPIQGSDEVPTLCGHVHEKWTIQQPGCELREYKNQQENHTKVLKQPVLNVGVDRHAFLPLSEAEVLGFFDV